jgi:hypothetical protein
VRAVLLILALSACADAPADAPAFADVQRQAFQGCALSTCHGSGTGGLLLDGTAADYDRLVGVAAIGDASQTLVVAGDADASYLVAKLEGAAGITGDAMPPGSSLSAETLQLVRDWIDGGALP